MYVKWKMLLTFGMIFWVLLCLYDLHFIDPKTKLFYSDSDEYGWLTTVSDEEMNFESITVGRSNEINFSDGKSEMVGNIVIWNVITFIATVLICIGAKYTSEYLWQMKNNKVQRLEHSKKSSCSKIPVLSSPSKSIINLQDEESDVTKDFFLKSTTYTDLSIRSSKSDLMEKQCSKLRDDMITMQALSLKEHAALSRKLESVTREKRELCRQLTAGNKENRAAKQQLEELLSEKDLLLKRLQCASKEFKTNTKSKKNALAKLEEAQAIISSLRQEVEKYKSEKNLMESKFRTSSLENQHLKEYITHCDNNCSDIINSKIINHAPPNETVENLKQITEFEELSQSHKDVQKVQMRLMNLERSLDKLKLSNWSKKYDSLKSKTTIVAKKEEFTEAPESDNEVIATKAECPLEDPINKSDMFKIDNLTDEQRENILIPVDSLSDDIFSISKNLDVLIEEFNIDESLEEGDVLKHTIRAKLPNEHYDGRRYFDDAMFSKASSSQNEDEDTDDWEQRQSGIVSNSPAFQKFLKKMDDIEKIQAKLTIETVL